MTADIFLRSVFFVFLGILAILQISFVYRIARIRRQTGHAPGPDQPAFSRQGSYRFALFLTAAYVFMIAFAAWEAATGRISWFLGLLLIVPALVLVRKPLRLVHTLAPTPVPPLVRLPAQPVVRDGITPSVIDEVLANPEVLAAIRSDVSMTGLIGHQETWRLGLIVRGRDEYVPSTKRRLSMSM